MADLIVPLPIPLPQDAPKFVNIPPDALPLALVRRADDPDGWKHFSVIYLNPDGTVDEHQVDHGKDMSAETWAEVQRIRASEGAIRLHPQD